MISVASKLFCMAGLLILMACNPFAPGEAEGDGGDFLLTDQTTPDKLLRNFQYAYTFKDSLVYSELLDSTFVFVSENFNLTPPEPIVWGRDQELKITGRMFRAFNTIDLTFNSIIRRDTIAVDTGDGEPSEIEDKITFTLTLDGGSTIPTLLGVVIFNYVREEKKWYLARWQDEVP